MKFSVPSSIVQISGWLYEQSGSYTIPYLIAGGPPILGSLLLTIIHSIKVPKESNSEWIDAAKLSERTRLSSEVSFSSCNLFQGLLYRSL
jgi:hypothetical protein